MFKDLTNAELQRLDSLMRLSYYRAKDDGVESELWGILRELRTEKGLRA
jgi:hypothetical protein